MTMTAANLWDQVLSRIETKVNRHSFYTWFKPTSFVSDDGSTVRVRVPNGLFRDWLTKHYSAVLDEALNEVERNGTAVSFVTEDAPPVTAELVPAPVTEAESVAPVEDDGQAGGLAPRYSFDTFIVGSSNQFAHAACRAVA